MTGAREFLRILFVVSGAGWLLACATGDWGTAADFDPARYDDSVRSGIYSHYRSGF